MTNTAATLQLATGFSRDALEYLLASQNEPEWLRARRREAWHLYEETPAPAPNDELWRRTSLKDLKLDAVIPFAPAIAASLPESLRIEPSARGAGVVVQYNTACAETWLSDEAKKRGVIFTDLRTAIQTHPELVREYLMTRAVTYTENRYAGAKTTKGEGAAYGDTIGDLKFVALHGAFFNVGTFLYVPRGVVLELPLQSLIHFDAPNVALLAHTLVIVEEGASVTLIERLTSQETEAQRFSNNAVELILKPGASVQYFHLQDMARNVWHFTSQTALLDRDAQLTWLNGTLGSQTTKAFLDCKFIGAGAQANLLGFFFGDGKQHFDQHTFQNHLVGQTASDLLYKGALKDRAYSVFRGLIRVNPNAQRSDAYQANRNLLLSQNAHADSIPELEIEANDVRCTHGATVGPIDPDQVFYLMTRGVSKIEAERLIVEGFFEPLLQKIPLTAVREALEHVIQNKIGTA
jgi:Fe-S cluster assembly protein SufD